VRPRAGDVIGDPACGTGGFLLAAYDFVQNNNPHLTRDQKKHLKEDAIRGVELVDAVTRLCAMNLLLHGVGPGTGDEMEPAVKTGDSLQARGGTEYDMVLTNPPFGKKSSVIVVNAEGDESRESLTIVRDDFWATTSNKQFNFVQHIRSILKTNGRAAVVVPDNVLFEGGAGETIRRKLLESCDVHTLLRLPTGIFYAQGVKANVIFFDKKPASEKAWTQELWIYDLRTNQHFTLKTNPLKREDLDDFVACYRPKNRQDRRETWSAENPESRWRRYRYEELLARDKVSLDITWLKDESLSDSENLPEPEIIAAEITEDLEAALAQFAEIGKDLA
jgi:type I restriction enzyme M protein